MKKITQILFLVIGLLGITFISTAQAVQPFKFITYGDVNAAFQTYFGASIVVEYGAENYHAAVVEGNLGHISPWYPTYHYVEDAHYVSVGYYFNTEDHELALELYKGEKEGLVKTHFLIDDIELTDLKTTALKRALWEFPPEAKYGWWYSTGVLFRLGEILAGEHIFHLIVESVNPDGIWEVVFEGVSPVYMFDY
jgi:hypothetical protein